MRGEILLRERGWDVATVDGQELSSVTDETLIEICRVEDRALVSFDKDFANVIHFRRFAIAESSCYGFRNR